MSNSERPVIIINRKIIKNEIIENAIQPPIIEPVERGGSGTDFGLPTTKASCTSSYALEFFTPPYVLFILPSLYEAIIAHLTINEHFGYIKSWLEKRLGVGNQAGLQFFGLLPSLVVVFFYLILHILANILMG